MNMFSFQSVLVACAAFTVLMPVYEQEASGAVVSDMQQAVHMNGKSSNGAANKKAESVTPDTIDAGYFKLQSEACVPLGPAQQTVMRITGLNRQLSTADAATLSFSWRQIQHYRVENVSPHSRAQCYYFAW